MEWMEPNAATAWIKNRNCQKMVKINEHRSHHDKSSLEPILFPQQSGKDKWYQEMVRIMNNMSNNFTSRFQIYMSPLNELTC